MAETAINTMARPMLAPKNDEVYPTEKSVAQVKP